MRSIEASIGCIAGIATIIGWCGRRGSATGSSLYAMGEYVDSGVTPQRPLQAATLALSNSASGA